MQRRIAFLAASLDGFIAGPGDDLAFLSPPEGVAVEDTFAPFIASVGAILMGRRTFDVVSAMDTEWPYGDLPIWVLTHRSLPPERPQVRAVEGSLEQIMAVVGQAAGEKCVYIDGGSVVTQALNAGLVDELMLTIVPKLLGQGVRLLDGLLSAIPLTLQEHKPLGAGFIQLRYRVDHKQG